MSPTVGVKSGLGNLFRETYRAKSTRSAFTFATDDWKDVSQGTLSKIPRDHSIGPSVKMLPSHISNVSFHGIFTRPLSRFGAPRAT
jgi:hypothetical protein